ncbi:MAG: hypothetical protein K1X81_01845 [Bacteroidia bacterium]|nr:hypothetical protein [Bacteroidia bacterium]
MATDILRDEQDDIAISETGDLVRGESLLQEVGLILRLNPGAVQHAPLIGPAITRFVKATMSQEELESVIALHFKMDNKDYRELKKGIRIK